MTANGVAKKVKGYREDICPWHEVRAAAALMKESLGEFLAKACRQRADDILKGASIAQKKTS